MGIILSVLNFIRKGKPANSYPWKSGEKGKYDINTVDLLLRKYVRNRKYPMRSHSSYLVKHIENAKKKFRLNFFAEKEPEFSDDGSQIFRGGDGFIETDGTERFYETDPEIYKRYLSAILNETQTLNELEKSLYLLQNWKKNYMNFVERYKNDERFRKECDRFGTLKGKKFFTENHFDRLIFLTREKIQYLMMNCRKNFSSYLTTFYTQKTLERYGLRVRIPELIT